VDSAGTKFKISLNRSALKGKNVPSGPCVRRLRYALLFMSHFRRRSTLMNRPETRDPNDAARAMNAEEQNSSCDLESTANPCVDTNM